MTISLIDTRRLPGPNVLSSRPGAVLDVACAAGEAEAAMAFCEARLREMLEAVGWSAASTHLRRLAGGFSLAFTAPIDVLYSASALAERVWAACDAEFNGAEAVIFAAAAAEIAASIAAESNPRLLAIEGAAAARQVPFLWDDDLVTVGHGSRAETWPFRELPDPDALDWSKYGQVPVGIITGTNGKTTTARIARHLLQAAGRTVGLSCTDWVAVNDRIVDRDDWSGPGGARLVLRQPGIDAAVLETARGGLLRRGLGIERADAAAIINVAEDHLGDFGSQNVAELLEIKWVVSHAVLAAGRLVLNAEDELLVGKAREFAGTIVWFALDSGNPVVRRHLAAGGSAVVLDGDEIVCHEAGGAFRICGVGDVPLTLGGAARHNVSNALAAAAVTRAMGLSLSDIGAGLASMSQESNPGRSNLHAVDGFSVLVDFAHNPQAMQALFSMARTLPAKRRALCFGQAGDRTDEQIRALARTAWSIGLDLAVISELSAYRRGREAGEVFGIIRDELIKAGARDDQILYFEDESESFDAALDWAGPGDLVVILDLGRKAGIREKLLARGDG